MFYVNRMLLRQRVVSSANTRRFGHKVIFRTHVRYVYAH